MLAFAFPNFFINSRDLDVNNPHSDTTLALLNVQHHFFILTLLALAPKLPRSFLGHGLGLDPIPVWGWCLVPTVVLLDFFFLHPRRVHRVNLGITPQRLPREYPHAFKGQRTKVQIEPLATRTFPDGPGRTTESRIGHIMLMHPNVFYKFAHYFAQLFPQEHFTSMPRLPISKKGTETGT